MVERIEKIARIKGVDYDLGKRFDSSRQNSEDGKSFAAELSRVMNKKAEKKVASIFGHFFAFVVGFINEIACHH